MDGDAFAKRRHSRPRVLDSEGEEEEDTSEKEESVSDREEGESDETKVRDRLAPGKVSSASQNRKSQLLFVCIHLFS